jgi:hypothetical protein
MNNPPPAALGGAGRIRNLKNYGEAATTGKSELKISSKTFQLPSLCFFQA